MEPENEKRAWKLTLSYDGTDFHGWQIQPAQATVQGELGAAIARITGEQVLPQGSGRTDAGVHALAQVASFILEAPIPEANLVRALNRTLPSSIRVLQAQRMPEGFHARHSARGKTYEYRIFRGEICPPWLARYVYGLNHPLDAAAMEEGARQVLGRHDFTSFAATDPDLTQRGTGEIAGSAQPRETEPEARSNVRTIFESRWFFAPVAPLEIATAEESPSPWKRSGDDLLDLLVYRVRGTGFLHHMVRNLVGTFLEVGRGNLAPEAIPAILAARSRAKAGATAPARGLFLTNVEY